MNYTELTSEDHKEILHKKWTRLQADIPMERMCRKELQILV